MPHQGIPDDGIVCARAQVDPEQGQATDIALPQTTLLDRVLQQVLDVSEAFLKLRARIIGMTAFMAHDAGGTGDEQIRACFVRLPEAGAGK
ncbi:MAG: hypothetical protein ABR558_06215 [Thioalkalivibrio sp.]